MISCAICKREFEGPRNPKPGWKCWGCARTKHGYAKAGQIKRLYSIWLGMRSRCKRGNKRARYHGDRGIKVCRSWSRSFAAFAKWAEVSGYRDDLTIDRIDNDGDYEPGNCQWLSQPAHGRKTFLKLTPEKVVEMKSLMVAGARNAELAERYGVSIHTVYAISRGRVWSEVPFPDGRTKKGLHGIQRNSPWPARRRNAEVAHA